MTVDTEEESGCNPTDVRSVPFFPEAQLSSSQKVEVSSRSGFPGEFQDLSEPVGGFDAFATNCTGERGWGEKVIFNFLALSESLPCQSRL